MAHAASGTTMGNWPRRCLWLTGRPMDGPFRGIRMVVKKQRFYSGDGQGPHTAVLGGGGETCCGSGPAQAIGTRERVMSRRHVLYD